MQMREHPDFSANLRRLSDSAWAYAALATAIELGVLDRLAAGIREAELADSCGIDPELAADLTEAMIGLGAIARDGEMLVPRPGLELLSGPTASRVLRGEVRSDHLQIGALLDNARAGGRARGWIHEDPMTLTAQGETGGLFGLLAEALLPGLDGLRERLEEGGFRVLDVGAGVGVISTEICRAWPEATVLGLEPHTTARELGRSRIAADGLGDRIELRNQRLGDLAENESFDLVFLPQPFIAPAELTEGLPTALRALRPGGWLLALTNSLDAEDAVTSAGRRFRAGTWGGGAMAAEDLARRLERVGFEPPRIDLPIGTFRTVCARRSPAPVRGGSPRPSVPADPTRSS